MDRYFAVVFVVAAFLVSFLFLFLFFSFFFGLAKSVFSLTLSVINLPAITGGKAEDSPAGFGEAPGSL